MLVNSQTPSTLGAVNSQRCKFTFTDRTTVNSQRSAYLYTVRIFRKLRQLSVNSQTPSTLGQLSVNFLTSGVRQLSEFSKNSENSKDSENSEFSENSKDSEN